MASSTSSIVNVSSSNKNNTMSHNHHPTAAPNPPPRTHSRPNQPPPPPPLPSVPPVPPTRDSSIAISKVAICNTRSPSSQVTSNGANAATKEAGAFLSQFVSLFKSIDELPLPEPFMNKPKTYPSQRAQQKQQQQQQQQQHAPLT